MSATDASALAGIHHFKLPVTDLAQSLEWYRSRLGYDVQAEAEREQRDTALVARRSAGPASEIAGYIHAVKP